jgi:hypothetical protein
MIDIEELVILEEFEGEEEIRKGGFRLFMCGTM